MISPDTAIAYVRAGLSALPAKRIDKHPATGRWAEWARRLPTETEAAAWFANPHDAICIVCGAVSGNLEIIDFDNGGELFEAWCAKAPQGLVSRLVVERSPSGGYHAAYRCESPVAGNLKLARGMRGGERTTLIETRGEGGLFLCSPTEGYELRQGSFEALPVLTADERQALLNAGVALDEAVAPPRPPQAAASFGDDRPGDDYNARGDIGPLLSKHGWTCVGERDGNALWRRPGKDSGGHSATFNGEVFYVFSSNALPFESERGYSRFQVYAVLECGGDFREAAERLREEGYGAGPQPAVDLSGILSNLPQAAPSGFSIPDPGELDRSLLQVPGVVGQIVDYSMSHAVYPNLPLAFAGAVSFVAMLCSRVFRDCRDSRANMYIVALAESGTGKDQPRKTNAALALRLGIGARIGESFASGEGLEDSLAVAPHVMLYQQDEMDSLMNAMNLKDAKAEGISERLLKFYGMSNGVYPMRRRAVTKFNPAPMGFIVNPGLNIFGTAVPDFLYGALSKRMLENGLVARCVFIEADPRGKAQRPSLDDFAAALVSDADYLAGLQQSVMHVPPPGANLLVPSPTPILIQETTEGAKAMDGFQEEFDATYAEYDRERHRLGMALWARAFEKVCKLAMVHAVSRRPERPVIDLDDASWAGRLVRHLTLRMLKSSEMFTHETLYDEMSKRLLRHLKAKGRVTHGDLLRASHLDKDTFKTVVATMAEAGQIREEVAKVGRTGQVQRTYVFEME